MEKQFKPNFKKAIAKVVILSIIYSLSTPIFAIDFQTFTNNSISTLDTNDVRTIGTATIQKVVDASRVKYAFSFPNVRDKLDSAPISSLEQFEHANFLSTTEFIDSLDISDALKAEYYSILETEFNRPGIIESFSLVVPTSSSEYTYYGTYNGQQFFTCVMLENLVTRYTKQVCTTLSKIQDFIDGVIDITLLVGDQFTNVAFAYFQYAESIRYNGYTVTGGNNTYNILYSSKTIRTIAARDNRGNYIPVIHDASAICHPYIRQELDYVQAGVSEAIIEGARQLNFTLYSEHYLNANYNLQKAYERFISNPDIPLEWTNTPEATDTSIDWSWG